MPPDTSVPPAAPDPGANPLGPGAPAAELHPPAEPGAAPGGAAAASSAPAVAAATNEAQAEAAPEAEAEAGLEAKIDPAHWLYRLTAEQWLSAADNELNAAYQALVGKQHRAGVTYARRAAGMALNARLRRTPDPAYGRSYMEHLQALRTDAAVSQELSDAASRLLAVPTTQQLVTLGPRGDTTPAELAGRIIEHVRAHLGHRGD